MVGKPKAQRGQVTRPWPHSEQRLTNGKGHLLQLLLDSSHLRQLGSVACPGPGAVFVNSAAPRGSALDQEERAARPSLTRFPACRPLKCSPPGIPSTPGAPWVPSGGAVPHPPSFPKANFSAGALYLFGGFAAAQSAVSAAHPPPGAPGLRLPTLGPPENPAVQAPLPAWRPPAGAAGETLKLNLEAQT